MKLKVILTICLLLPALAYGGQWEKQSQAFRRWPKRVVNGRQYNLAPLYPWWTNAVWVEVCRDPRTRSNRIALQQPLPNDSIPPKPVQGWYRITGTNFTDHSYYWVVQGTVEDNPGLPRPATFQLRHPPGGDKAQFARDWTDWKALVNQGHVFVVSKRFLGPQGQDIPDAPEGAVPIDETGNAWLVNLRGDALDHALEVARRIAFYPPGGNYRIDFFAARLGPTSDETHMEVYDLGLVPGQVGN